MGAGLRGEELSMEEAGPSKGENGEIGLNVASGHLSALPLSPCRVCCVGHSPLLGPSVCPSDVLLDSG